MAKKFPVIHWFPGFPKPRNLRNLLFNVFNFHSSSFKFLRVSKKMPSFRGPVSLVSTGCPSGATCGN